jgi:hypothetical protein
VLEHAPGPIRAVGAPVELHALFRLVLLMNRVVAVLYLVYAVSELALVLVGAESAS